MRSELKRSCEGAVSFINAEDGGVPVRSSRGATCTGTLADELFLPQGFCSAVDAWTHIKESGSELRALREAGRGNRRVCVERVEQLSS
jgi:hypothetical protein